MGGSSWEQVFLIMAEDCRIMLSEDGLELIVDDILDVLCAIGISLGAGSWRMGIVIFDFFVEEELKGRECLGCSWSSSPFFAGSGE